MNRNDFLKIMDCTGALDSRMTGDLNELVTVFPYFQSAHMLLLKGLKDNSDVRFSIQLRNSSIHVADREVLYRFLQEPPESIVEELTVVEPPGEIRVDLIEETTVIETPEVPPVIIDEEHTVVEAPEVPPVIIVEEHTVVEAPEVPPVIIVEEHTVVEAPPESTVSIVEELAEIPEPEVEPVDESVPEAPEIVPAEPVLYTETEQSVIETAMNSDEIINQLEGENLPEPQEEEDYQEKIMLTPAEELPELEIKEEKPEKDTRKQQSELIDRFIIANPRIEPDRERKGAPAEDKSVPLYNESVFVTETLAKIYISQGYYSRAIDIFEKLSLKYPEKSSYFATQIEKVKELLKK